MRLSFGDFWLDLAERRLWRGSNEILLTPKAFEVLSYLAKRPNQLVLREQLMKELWPDTFVDDHALSFQIAEIRKVLGDDPKRPHYIETRPRRGYRFMAEIPAEPPAKAPLPIPTEITAAPAPIASDKIPETRYARSGDVNIAYQVIGDGPMDVVFVMGWVSHLEYFWREPRFASFLRRLASFSRLILFDKRGTGLSDRVPLNQLPTLEQRMDDVRAVMEAAGSHRAAIVGVSEGGPLSVLFSATYPEKALGLVMIGSYARRLRDAGYPWGPSAEERDAYCRLIRAQWGGPVGIEERAPTLANDPEFRDWWATYLRMGASPGAAEALTRMNAEIDIRPILGSIRVPTLVLHRTDDKCLLVEEGRYMASRIPGARFVELPGADHLPFAGPQSQMLEEIETFLTGLGHRVQPERALATALFLDVPGRVRLSDPVSANSLNMDRLRREIEWFRGREADMDGGAPLATFDGPVRAVRCAFAMVAQGALLRVPARAALHTGECEFTSDGRPSGYTIDLAGQILPVTPPGTVVVSRVVKDLVAGSGIRFSPRQQLRLSNEAEEWPLFEVVSC
ncbi:MAG TPA: alpha/beta fold hydrolase [Bryobacteraceae bacterium]|nr:alpha/beta fold hydrolase [Bryobacteraceae bacterium]